MLKFYPGVYSKKIGASVFEFVRYSLKDLYSSSLTERVFEESLEIVCERKVVIQNCEFILIFLLCVLGFVFRFRNRRPDLLHKQREFLRLFYAKEI